MVFLWFSYGFPMVFQALQALQALQAPGSAYSERSVSSMVSLLRSDREALNWLLLGPDPAWLQVRRGTSGYAKTEQLVVPGARSRANRVLMMDI